MIREKKKNFTFAMYICEFKPKKTSGKNKKKAKEEGKKSWRYFLFMYFFRNRIAKVFR